MDHIKAFFSSHEEWLVERILAYAKRQGYAEYMGELREVWRISIARFSDALSEAGNTFREADLKFTPDEMFIDDPISVFVINEFRLQRERGLSLSTLLGLLKYYRKTYLDCILELAEKTDKEQYCPLVDHFFDRLEIALCVDWTRSSDPDRLAELQARNRAMSDEKNKFLALFESLTTPVFLLDYDFNIEIMNLSAAEFLGLADEQGELYHIQRKPSGKPVEKRPLRDIVPWLAEALNQSCSIESGQEDCRFDVSAPTALGSRHFNVSISNMSEISDTFVGYAVTLDEITFRVEMEKQLASERNRATHYLDIVGSIVVVLDASGLITLINRTGCLTLGYDEHELIGQNWIDLIIPNELGDEVCDYLSQIVSSQVEVDDEHVNYVTTKDGTHRLISWKNRLLTNAEGIPTGVLSAGMDVTEQREAEAALAEKELWLRNTFVALGEAVLILTPDRRILDVNPAAEVMFQMTNEEFDSLPVEALHIDSDHYHEFGKRSQAAFAVGETAVFEFFLRRKDGEVFPTEHSVSLILGDDGEPLGIVSVIRDISDRKKAEQELKQSEEKFRRIFETIREGYIVTDLDGIILMVNPATCLQLGYKESDLVGVDMERLYSNTTERTSFKSIIISKGSVRGFQLTALCKDGSTIIVEANAHLVLNESGIPVAMEGTFRDITERIEADKIFREREKLYRAFFENNHAIMLLVDPKTGDIVDANPAASMFYGYSCDKMRTMLISDITAQTEEEIYREMVSAKQEKRVYFILRHKLASGETRDVEVYSGPILVQGNQLLYSVIHDVTERIRLEREMKQLATIDTLTGANNRHQFFSLAVQEFNRAKRYGHPLVVLMLDIDYFKSINDTHGHQAGDVVLRALSAMAQVSLREMDVFGRIGGEEFAAALPETDLEAGLQAADRLRDELAKLKVQTKEADVSFTVSIGVTLVRAEDQNIEETIHRADEALYKAKKMGRNRVEKG